MSKEIEKKYLIREDNKEYFTKDLSKLYNSIDELVQDIKSNGKKIKQGYMSVKYGLELVNELGESISFTPVEARLRNKASKLFLTLKGNGNLSRSEFEREIPEEFFNKYWKRTKGKRVEKIRLEKEFGGYIAEFDFHLDRSLVTVEVEVQSLKIANDLAPLGKDITEDKSYKNKNLAK